MKGISTCLSLALAAGILGCHYLPPDDVELRGRYRAHRKELEAIVQLLQDSPGCEQISLDHQVGCQPAIVASARCLLRIIGAQGVARREDGEIAVGFEWVGMGIKGFAFREVAPASIVPTTDLSPQLQTRRFSYAPIEGNWYIQAFYD